MSIPNKHYGLRLGSVSAATLALGFAAARPAGATQSGPSGATQSMRLADYRPALATRSESASVANGTLTVTGTNASDRIALRLAAGDPNTLQVDFGDDGSADQSFNRSTFTAISVFLGNGDDHFRVDEINGTFADKALMVDGGNGDDTITTGAGNDLIVGGTGNDTISAGAGDDVIFGGAGNDSVTGGPGHDIANLDAGQDTFVWNPGDGSDVIDGGAGNDTMVFNGSNANEIMSLSANGSHSVFLRDVGVIRMDMNNVEQLNLATLGGAHAVTINDMTGTDFRKANINLSAASGAGDGQPDVVTVNGTDTPDTIKVAADGAQVDVKGLKTETTISGSETMDHLQVNSLGGNDRVEVNGNVFPLIGVGVDLGTGQH